MEVGEYLVGIHRGGVGDHARGLCFSGCAGVAEGGGGGSSGAIFSALSFGFAWGYGAICFGRSVDRLGVSLANSMVTGLSSALAVELPFTRLIAYP